jgi:hypothetical protein
MAEGSPRRARACPRQRIRCVSSRITPPGDQESPHGDTSKVTGGPWRRAALLTPTSAALILACLPRCPKSGWDVAGTVARRTAPSGIVISWWIE